MGYEPATIASTDEFHRLKFIIQFLVENFGLGNRYYAFNITGNPIQLKGNHSSTLKSVFFELRIQLLSGHLAQTGSTHSVGKSDFSSNDAFSRALKSLFLNVFQGIRNVASIMQTTGIGIILQFVWKEFAMYKISGKFLTDYWLVLEEIASECCKMKGQVDWKWSLKFKVHLTVKAIENLFAWIVLETFILQIVKEMIQNLQGTNWTSLVFRNASKCS